MYGDRRYHGAIVLVGVVFGLVLTTVESESTFRPNDRSKIYPSTELTLGRSRRVDPETSTSTPPDSTSPDSAFDSNVDSDPTRRRRRRLTTVDDSLRRRLTTVDDSPRDDSPRDDSGGSEGGAPPLHCEVFAHADGLGVRGSSLAFRDLFDDDATDAAAVRVVNATFPSVGGDSWRVSAAYQGGRLGGFHRACASRGVPYGFLTTKCADDGTSSGFLVSTNDRYDLRGVSETIARLRPAPFLVSGGFSRSLFEATSREVGSPTPPPPRGLGSLVLRAYGVDERLRPVDADAERRATPEVVEFDTLGNTAYGETCEYPPTSSFEERATRAVRKGVAAARASPRRSFFLALAYTAIDAAAHAENDSRRVEALDTLRRALASMVREMNATCAGGWRLTVVGSHATGGGGLGTALHGRHSPPGTPVPFYRLEKRGSVDVGVVSPVDEVELFARFRDAQADDVGDGDGSTTIVPGVRWIGFGRGSAAVAAMESRRRKVIEELSAENASGAAAADARHHDHHHHDHHDHHHHGGHRYHDARHGRPLTFWEAYLNVVILVLLFAFVPCCLCAAASGPTAA